MPSAEISKALVIVPTYNEADSIAEVVGLLFDACGDAVDLLVVDDGSPDGTADLVEDMSRTRPAIHLLRRTHKQGLGTAYVAGFRWAIERGYPFVVEMDADLSHDPADVPRLLQRAQDADLVIGSRYVPGGRIENWGPVRTLLSRGGNLYARAWLGFSVKDSTSGFRAYKTSVLENEDLESLRSEGYAFQIELTRRIHLGSGSIVEVPITFVERIRGASKMSRAIVIEAMASVTRWGLRDRLRSRNARGSSGRSP